MHIELKRALRVRPKGSECPEHCAEGAIVEVDDVTGKMLKHLGSARQVDPSELIPITEPDAVDVDQVYDPALDVADTDVDEPESVADQVDEPKPAKKKATAKKKTSSRKA